MIPSLFSFDNNSSVSPPIPRREPDGNRQTTGEHRVKVLDLASKELEITTPTGEVFRIRKGGQVRYAKDKTGQPCTVVNIDVNFRVGEQPDVDLKKPDGGIVNTTIKNLLPYDGEKIHVSNETSSDEEPVDSMDSP